MKDPVKTRNQDHDEDVPAKAPAAAKEEPAAAKEEPFKLAPVGSKDYVAGQPVDEAELAKVTEEDNKRKAAGKAAADKVAADRAAAAAHKG